MRFLKFLDNLPCIFHNYRPILKKETSNFLDQKIIEDIPNGFRTCSDCQKCQEQGYDMMSSYWIDLGPKKSKIVLDKIEEINGVLYFKKNNDINTK